MLAAIAVAIAASVTWAFLSPTEGLRGDGGPIASARERDLEAPIGACEHRYVPVRVGAFREYLWEGDAESGTIRMELMRASPTDEGAAFIWSVEDDLGNRSELVRGCDEDGAEEPWRALGAMPTGLELREQSWRVPRVLEVGDRYAGTLQVTIASISMPLTRSHRVAARETVTVAGETFDTLRVEIEETSPAATEPVPSVQWLADGVGLVRGWVGPEGYRTTVELVRHGARAH